MYLQKIMKKGTLKSEILKITMKTSFVLAHEDNANRVALALCRSGYYVNIVNTSGGFWIKIYQII